MSRLARELEALYAPWRSDIRVFARQGLRIGADIGLDGPTWQQDELLELVQLESYLPPGRRRKRIAVKSGQGTGKTAAAVGIVGLWRALRAPDALTILTAPSMKQCGFGIMEVKRLLRDAHPALRSFVECYQTRVEVNGEPMWGIRTVTATKTQNLQGIHEKRLTFVVDEASGVARELIETIEGTLSNPDSLLVMIGNPNTTDCKFYDCFTVQRDLWHCLTWNAEDTARDYPQLLSPSRNRALEFEYGRDSDVYRVRVLGEFPHQNPNSIMSLEDLVACTKTSIVGCAGITDLLPCARAIGIDLARYGGDESVVVRRSGLAVVGLKHFFKRDPREVVDYAFKCQRDAGWRDDQCAYVVDAGGMGQGILHAFYEAGKRVVEFHNEGVAADSAMYSNQYSEAWWSFRNLARERIVHLPSDPRLLRQLSTREYYSDRKGRIKVETKDEWRARLSCDESPDRADAVAMAFYPHVGQEVRVARADDRRTPRRSR